MSIKSEIDRISDNVASTYSVLSDAGAVMPAEANSDNLAQTAASISAVLYGKAQSLTDAQKAQARANIGAVAADGNIATATKLQTSSSTSSGSQSGLYWCVYEWTLTKGWESYSAIFAVIDSENQFSGILAVKNRNSNPSNIKSIGSAIWMAADKTPPAATITYTQNDDSVTYRLYIALGTYKTYNIAKILEFGSEGTFVNTKVTEMTGTVSATSNSVSVQYANSAGQATKDSNGNVIADTYVKKTEVTSGVFTAKATLPASGWVEDTGNYTWRWHQTIAVDGILETDEPLIDLYLNGLTEEQEDAVAEGWAYMVKITTSTNAITAYVCDLPEVDIPIKIKEVR